MTSSSGKETAAKIGFVGFMALALGGVGIVIAALAVGLESAFNRNRDSGQSWQEWLEEDSRRRAADRAARRQWWNESADPSRQPAPKAGGARNSARRTTARGRAFGSGLRRFFGGFGAGWRAAKRRRADGGTFRDVRTAKPADVVTTTPPGGPPTPGSRPGPTIPDPPPPPTPPAGPAWERRPPIVVAPAVVDKPATTPTQTASTVPEFVDGEVVDTQPGISPAENETRKELMATEPPTKPAAGPDGDTNLDQILADLAAAAQHLGAISDLADQIANVNAQMKAAVEAALDRAEATGAPGAAIQALDAANAAAAQVATSVSAMSAGVTEAEDQVNAARAALRPAEEAQDTLHSAGARGEVVSAATN